MLVLSSAKEMYQKQTVSYKRSRGIAFPELAFGTLPAPYSEVWGKRFLSGACLHHQDAFLKAGPSHVMFVEPCLGELSEGKKVPAEPRTYKGPYESKPAGACLLKGDAT